MCRIALSSFRHLSLRAMVVIPAAMAVEMEVEVEVTPAVIAAEVDHLAIPEVILVVLGLQEIRVVILGPRQVILVPREMGLLVTVAVLVVQVPVAGAPAARALATPAVVVEEVIVAVTPAAALLLAVVEAFPVVVAVRGRRM